MFGVWCLVFLFISVSCYLPKPPPLSIKLLGGDPAARRPAVSVRVARYELLAKNVTAHAFAVVRFAPAVVIGDNGHGLFLVSGR